MRGVPPDLIRDVDVLSLDAGNTVIFLDHPRLASLCRGLGFDVRAERLVAAEGETKHAHERGTLIDVPWNGAHLPGARGWGSVVGTILVSAGLEIARASAVLESIWLEHLVRNLWSLVPPGLVDALAEARRRGVGVVVVSNSEGHLEELFRDLGILSAFDAVIDSGVVGVEKPDPRIFRVALERCGGSADRALHLGDSFPTDVLGARAAGIRVALVDPLGHLAGRHDDVPRVPGAAEVARALASARA